MSLLRRLATVLLAAAVSAACAHTPVEPSADPPLRAGRLAEFGGSTWVFDHDQGRWAEALRNRPLAEGDRVSTAADGRATLQLGSTRIWLDGRSEIELLRLDEGGVQLQLHAGSAALRIRHAEAAHETELSTREARFKPLRAGLYRFDRLDDTTFAATVRGDLMLEDRSSMPIGPGTRVEFWRSRNGTLEQRAAPWPQDSFHQALLREEQRDERSASLRHVSPEMTGADELEAHGRWERHPEYGAVWAPITVAVGWSPFREGRWIWMRPWGWTWVDAQPWGFVTSHYGRWVTIGARWVWVPGVYTPHPVFAPALVTWVGRPSVSIGITIGGGPRPLPGSSWHPLPPYAPWQPWYPATPRYVDRVNRGPWPHRPHVEREPRPRERPALPVAPGLRSEPPPVVHGPAPWPVPAPMPGARREPPPMRHTPVPVQAERPPEPRPPEPLPPRPNMRIPQPVGVVPPQPGIVAPAPPAAPATPPRTAPPSVRHPEAEDKRKRTPDSPPSLRAEREALR